MEKDLQKESTGHAPKKKTAAQIELLEKFFLHEKYPKHDEMEAYALTVNLTYKQVRIWFKERRRKEKRGMGCYSIQKKKSQTLKSHHSVRCTGSNVSSSSHYMRFQNGLQQNILTGASLRGKNIGPQRIVQVPVRFPKEYILRKIFRKDGPPLGMEFDSPLKNALHTHADDTSCHSCDGPSTTKTRMALESENTILTEKHGIGKGLMTAWHAIKLHNGEIPVRLEFSDGSAGWSSLSSDIDITEVSEESNDGQDDFSGLGRAHERVQKKAKEINVRAKDQCDQSAVQCNLFSGEKEYVRKRDECTILVEDEELELREIPAGTNMRRCSAHLMMSGLHGCPLCKDLLMTFPPRDVKMKQPFSTRPWNSSPQLVRKIFKILQFIYSHSECIDADPCTVDEFAQAFHDKDSVLLGQVQLSLLKLLLSAVERAKADDFFFRSTKDSRFLNFLNFFQEQRFDANMWLASLNALTWIEILRQVLVAGGFGCVSGASNSFCTKEKSQMVKYGLRSCTLKGELFALLSKNGCSGLNTSDLAKSMRIVELNLPNTAESLEHLIRDTLSSDITLFEKIGSSTYRLRVDPSIKGKEDSDSDTIDSGSVDDDNASSDDSGDECMVVKMIRDSRVEKELTKQLARCSEIDDSYSGETWMLGLMEGEYADLRIDEKVDALVALVDLVSGAGPGLFSEDPINSALVSSNRSSHHSGGKIKKSTRNSILRSSMSSNGASGTVGTKGSRKQRWTGGIHEDCFGSTANNDNHHLQCLLLGSDRRYNNYWLFLGPCLETDPGHRRVYFESSDDGHWEVIDTSQDLRMLISLLDERGVRESQLLASLQRREPFLTLKMELNRPEAFAARPDNASDQPNPYSIHREGSSPISDVDNVVIPSDPPNCSASTALDGAGAEEKQRKFDRWIWSSFYSSLNAVNHCKKSFVELLAHCECCHYLYWRDEKHCRVCHCTFEISFDLEERYAVHVATCGRASTVSNVTKYNILPSQLQAIKAAVYAIEASMPEESLISSWMKCSHNLWVNRLRRTSSLAELLQVLIDFVGAINEDWLRECGTASDSPDLHADDIIIHFQTMPQTSSAVALWIVKLDSLLVPHLEKARSRRQAPRILHT